MYSETENEKRGAAAIGDQEKAEDHGGQGANAAATSAGMAYCAYEIFTGTLAGNKAAKLDGWVALAFGGLSAAFGIIAMVLANAFDNGYADRTSCRDNGDATNETLDGYTSSLEETMDSMNEDGDEYKDLIKNYTLSKNDNINRKAEAQMELMDAMAMGDKKKVVERV